MIRTRFAIISCHGAMAWLDIGDDFIVGNLGDTVEIVIRCDLIASASPTPLDDWHRAGGVGAVDDE